MLQMASPSDAYGDGKPSAWPGCSPPQGPAELELGTALGEQTKTKAALLTAGDEDVLVSTLRKAVWFRSAQQSWSERLQHCPCQVGTWSNHALWPPRALQRGQEVPVALRPSHVAPCAWVVEQVLDSCDTLLIRWGSNLPIFRREKHIEGEEALHLDCLGAFCLLLLFVLAFDLASKPLCSMYIVKVQSSIKSSSEELLMMKPPQGGSAA